MLNRKRYLLAGTLGALLLTLAAWGPAGARSIRERVEFGSILIEVIGGNPPLLVGLAFVANPGLEKTLTYQLPKLTASDSMLTLPLFLVRVDNDAPDPGDPDQSPPRLVRKNMDTSVLLSNGNGVGGTAITVSVTFRRADGSPIPSPGNPVRVMLQAGQTVLISAADALNP